MTRLATFFLSLSFVIVSLLPGGFAGPACARRHWMGASCLAICASKWGFPGSIMGTDPWGAVMKPTGANVSTVLSEACGAGAGASVQSSGNPSPTSSYLTPTTSVLISPPIIAPASSSLSVSSSSAISSSTLKPTTSHSVSRTHLIQQLKTTTASPTPHTTHTQAPPPASTKPAPPPPQHHPLPNSGTQPNGGSSSQNVQDVALSAHNSFRAQHGASPLSWSDELAGKAQQWASACVFKHSGGSLGPFGENLAAGTGSSYNVNTGVGQWTVEQSRYNPNNPQPSHFTQVVWKGSKQLGCAVAECNDMLGAGTGDAKYLVCEYSPQGNIIGDFSGNVQL